MGVESAKATEGGGHYIRASADFAEKATMPSTASGSPVPYILICTRNEQKHAASAKPPTL